MRLLAFDTSTDAMSIAVAAPRQGRQEVWHHTAAGGAQASATLLPAILDLMARAGLVFADLDALAFGCGPGAFTGLRTACSVAQGLSFGASAQRGGRTLPVLPVDSLLAVAEEARQLAFTGDGDLRVLAMLDARMDEIYAGSYVFDGKSWRQESAPVLEQPEHLGPAPAWRGLGWMLAGNVFATYGDRLPVGPSTPRVTALPTATALLRLAPGLLAAGHAVAPELALPTYIRDKVAQTTSERAALKVAAGSA